MHSAFPFDDKELFIRICAERFGYPVEMYREYFWGNGNPSWEELCEKYGIDPEDIHTRIAARRKEQGLT